MRTGSLSEILAATAAEGSEAHLWVHDSGDVILWPCESDSTGDNGRKAVAGWHVTSATLDQLLDSGEVDEVA